MVCGFTAAKVSLRYGEKIDQESWTLYLSILPSLLRDSSLLTYHFLNQAIFGLYFPLPWVHAKVQLLLCLEPAVLLKREAQGMASLLISRILNLLVQLVVSNPGC